MADLSEKPATSATAAVAAGLLDGAGALTPDITAADAADHLRDLLRGTSSLWRPMGRQGPAARDVMSEQPPRRWSPPSIDVDAALAERLAAAWATAVRDHPGRDDDVRALRVCVVDPAQADALPLQVDGIRIVPLIERFARRFVWQWPVRIRVASKKHAREWVERIQRARPGDLVDVAVIAMDADAAAHEDVELLIVDADDADRAGAPNPGWASCVVMVSGVQGANELLERAAEWTPAIAIGLPVRGVDWLGPVVSLLASDHPIDVACSATVPAARVAADPNLVGMTALGRWAVAVGDQQGHDVRQRLLVAAERLGSRWRGGPHRVLAAGAGLRFEVEIGFAMAEPPEPPAPPPPSAPRERPVARSAGPSEEPSAAPAAAPSRERAVGRPAARSPRKEAAAPRRRTAKPKARHLVAAVCHDGKELERALVPDAEHQLEVAIKVPDEKRGVAAAAAIPEHEIEGEGGAVLDIEVSSDALGLREVRQVFLPTDDRSKPSTLAVFTFTAGPDGSLVDLKILVLHQGRPIQALRWVAPVRKKPVAGDKPVIAMIPLSASPEPRPGATAASTTLDVDGATLRRVGADGAVDLTPVREMVDEIEQLASRVLTAEQPPTSLDDKAAVELLVDLARRGSRLRDHLAPLRIEPDGAIAVLVDHGSTVLPLELVYDAPAPRLSAKLCEHATGRAPKAGTRCTKASATRVCPYAFWGTSRVIARTFAFDPSAGVEHRELDALELRPILYAAADKADIDHGDDGKPSDLLERELADLTGGRLTRVRSWKAWRTAVKAAPAPQLFVVLGHTDLVRTEPTLFIGDESKLGTADVDAAVVGAGARPVVVLLACATAALGDAFGTLPAAFAHNGAAAVVATLAKLRGPHGAKAAAAVVKALKGRAGDEGVALGTALCAARRQLIKDGMLIGLLLVVHGEVDVKLVA